jgi:hypothetical protein
MVPSPLNTESPAVVVGAVDASKAFGSVKADSLETKPHELQVSFSHVQLYVDGVEDIQVYKDLESKLNEFARLSSKHELEEDAHNRGDSSRATEKHELWQGRIETETKECDNQDFVAQNRETTPCWLWVSGYGLPLPFTRQRSKHTVGFGYVKRFAWSANRGDSCLFGGREDTR